MENFNWITGAVVPYFNFFLFLAVLIWAAKKPLKQMAEARYRKYVDLHSEAKNAFAEAKAKNEELKEKLNNLKSEIDNLREVALQNAKHEYDVMIKQAHILGDHIVEEAKMIADAEVESAREAIRQEIVMELTTQVKSKLADELNATKQQELIQNQFKKMESVNFEGTQV